jgi:hypothetical protein
MGRPSRYSAKLVELICGRLASGESLRSICRDEELPHMATVMNWLGKESTFREQYALAREVQAEYLVDEIVEIADDGVNDYMEKRDAEGKIIGWRENGEFIQRSRLRVDARKWAASKLAPKKYGDKIQNEHAGPDGGPIPIMEVDDATRARALAAFLAKTKAGKKEE